MSITATQRTARRSSRCSRPGRPPVGPRHPAAGAGGGGGPPRPAEARARLCDDLARVPGAASFIAWRDEQPIGLVNSFEAYSTFKARPLLNVHDIVVLPAHRGAGVGQALLDACEAHARERGCCKLTLEVLSGNPRALRSYERFGFAPYALAPAAGQALLMQKWL